jgi:ribosomal 50S subunit-recycling heat shock protein
MLVAKIENGRISSWGKSVSYPELEGYTGTPALVELGFLPLVMSLPLDEKTEKLVAVQPFIQGGKVYIVAKEAKTSADIDADKAAALEQIRSDRNSRLLACDWTQLPDSTANKAAWATYRQALRDLPNTLTDPRDPVVWPQAPQ